MQQRFLLQILLLAQHVSGHHYAHHQEIKNIIQWLLPVVFRAVVFKLLQHPANRTHNPQLHTRPTSLPSVYFVNKPLHVSSIFVAHHQEVYCIYTTIDNSCGFQLTVCCPIPAKSQSTENTAHTNCYIQGVTGGTDQTSGECSLC